MDADGRCKSEVKSIGRNHRVRHLNQLNCIRDLTNDSIPNSEFVSEETTAIQAVFSGRNSELSIRYLSDGGQFR